MRSDFEDIPFDGDWGKRVFGKVINWENVASRIVIAGGRPTTGVAINKHLLIEALKHVDSNESGRISLYPIAKEDNREPIMAIAGANGMFILCGMEE